ncbi:response regulator transcription factor [Sulfuritalea hydrogenivorans]|uniref:Response regulator receiver protein n=1 Tax=Sulfuritalea hydrogenivorans sk43H TaxID=1223802 RepID=W0SEF6_9PROT|nr:response regulator [Sulfuritalea hydrogenivorans]BAO29619.1 response regulator receiver protein [Sulfuritalea hydrogenivorans sk43H]
MSHKILVVDDHPEIRRMIRLSLGDDFEVLEAEDGQTALGIIRHKLPRIVLLDVKMPGLMTGFEVLETIKSTHAMRDVIVIMVTAYGQARDYDKGMDLGADAYFVKPFSPLQLAAAIRELVN